MSNVLIPSSTINLMAQAVGYGSLPQRVLTEPWQLPRGSYVRSRVAGRILSPRPDVETDTNGALAYYRHNHSQMDYKVRICVKGMSWPFKYELVTAPAGATIGSELTRTLDPATGLTVHTWNDDYAIVKWLNPTAGTHTFTVRVTDQEGLTEEVTWTTTQDDSKFVFVDSVNGNDTNSGAIASPLATVHTGVWKLDDNDTTFVGRQLVFRAGTYPIYATAPNTSPVMDNTKKPITWRAFDGEVATMDTTQGHFRDTNGTGLYDISFIGLRLSGSRSDLNNNRMFNLLRPVHRGLFWGMSFANTTVGNVGTDNPCSIGFYDNNATPHLDLAVVDCTLESTAKTQLHVTFSTRYFLSENNVIDNPNLPLSNGAAAINLKDDTSEATVRHNRVTGTYVLAGLIVPNQNSVGAGRISNQEVCYNTVVVTMTGDGGVALHVNQAASTPNAENLNIYRNTVVSTVGAALGFYSYPDSDPAIVGANLLCQDATTSNGTRGVHYYEFNPMNVMLDAIDFDVMGKLTGTARTTHLGTMGAEVAA